MIMLTPKHIRVNVGDPRMILVSSQKPPTADLCPRRKTVFQTESKQVEWNRHMAGLLQKDETDECLDIQ